MPDDPMPVFTLKAKDKLATAAVRAYHASCVRAGLIDQAVEVEKAHKEIPDWQRRNPEAMKLPDHPHVPVAASDKGGPS